MAWKLNLQPLSLAEKRWGSQGSQIGVIAAVIT
jgi:hypothetical protein